MAMRDLIPWRRHDASTDVSRGSPLALSGEHNPVTHFRRQMDRLFDDFFSLSPFSGGLGSAFLNWPSVEVKEGEDKVTVTAELPGLTDKDVEVLVEDGVLTLRGERKSVNEDKDRGWSERYYGSFERRVALPDGADEEKCEADFRDGVLTVTMPKSESKRKSRKIPILKGASKT